MQKQQEIIFFHNQSPLRAHQRRSLDLARPEPVLVECAVLREDLGSRVQIIQSFEDGVESHIDEFRIGCLGRVGQASDLVGLTAINHLFGTQRPGVQAQARGMVGANVLIPLRTTESIQRFNSVNISGIQMKSFGTFFWSFFAAASEILFRRKIVIV